MKRHIVQILGFAAIAGFAVGGYRYYRNTTRPPEFTYRTAKVDRGNIVARVTATGTLSAHVTVQVGSQVSGRLQQINVDFNSAVKKGDVIAKIDAQLFEATLAQARANVLGAHGDLAKAKVQVLDADRKFTRAKAMRAEGLLSQADYDTAEIAVEVAKAQVKSANGALAQAQAQEHAAAVNLAYTTIVSPIDGTVISRNVDVGQTVAASLSAPTLFTIAEDLRKMQVDTNITEGDVGKLKPFAKATFVVDAFGSERFSGTIRQIRNAAQTVQNVVTYDAVIDVDNDELKLKPGMTANATVIYDRREAVLRVPNAAFRFRPPPALAASTSASVGRRGEAPSDVAPTTSGGAPAPELPASALPSAATASPAGSAGRRRHHEGSGGPAETADARPPRAGGSSGGQGQGAAGRDAPIDQRVLWVLRGPRPTPIPVRSGLTDGTLTEILSGDLNEGDAVVLEATSSDDSTAVATPRSPTGGGAPPRMRL